jgi:hypothetical protein
MVKTRNVRIDVTRLLSLFLCFMIGLVSSCSLLKSRDDEDDFAQGTTVSLDELDYAEGVSPPLAEEDIPPGETAASAKLSQTTEGTRNSLPSAPAPGPVRRLRKRVFVPSFGNSTKHQDQPYGEITAQKLIQALQGSDQVVVLDDRRVGRFVSERGITPNDLRQAFWTKELSEAFGVHAVISGTLTELNVATTKSSVSQDIEVGLAIAKIEVSLVDASTGNTIRTFTGRNPIYKSKEIGEFNQERAILRAIDIGVDDIAPGLLDSLRFLEWSARVIRIDSQRIYISAGRESGLREGDLLRVYGPGEEIINPVSRLSLGWAPGPLKGRIRVSGFFGVDGAYATPVQGDDFETQDVVKVGERQEP